MDGTGIYQLSGRGVKSVADYDMEAANLDAAKQQGQLRSLQLLTGQQGLEEKQRQLERAGALRQLAGTWKADTTDDQRIATLRNAGFADEADKLLEGSLKRKDVESQAAQRMSEADKNRLGLFTTKLEQNHKMWETVTNPAEAHALVDATFADPEMAAVARARGQTPEQAHASIPDGKDPKAFQDFLITRSKGMDALIKYLRPDANTVANNQTSTANNAATNARVAAEGAANRAQQERQHAATRADAAQAVTYQTDPDTGLTVALPSRLAPGAPVEARNVTVGGVPLKGKNADKPLNDAQSKALLFGTRAQESGKIIDDIGDNYSPMAINSKQAVGRVPLIGGALEGASNAMLSDNNQKAEQAQRDFVNAILRRESGAVIADSEFANAARQYFPQPGDSKAVKEQKAKNRALAIKGVLAEVPKGQRAAITPQATTNIDDLLNKYK